MEESRTSSCVAGDGSTIGRPGASEVGGASTAADNLDL